MSQEDTTKPNKTNPNNHYNGNNNNNHSTMKFENKRSAAAALYENFMPNDNNNKHPNFEAEREPNKSAPFNNEQGFVHNTTSTNVVDDRFVASEAQRYVKDKRLPDYENLNFNRHQPELDKKVLLQKYFRTALVGPRTNIYENLCRGCNYGVFSARGPLCSFCECIVNGVPSIRASPAESSSNIYENICANCAQFYSGNEEDCQCRKRKELVVSFCETEVEEVEVGQTQKVGSEDCLLAKDAKEQKVKIRKSKSFNKSTKPKILTNFWDTLRKNKAPAVAKKPLEIVHNVEGYDQVFHTKESFDLQRICELKRSATSCSDQHIYGRLKQKELVRSQEEFLSTQSLTHADTQVGKKRHISKPKFLRSLSASAPPQCTNSGHALAASTSALQAVFLNNSVCQWMTSLRREFNSDSLNTCILNLTDEESDCQCYPKSIPPKKLLSCKTAPQPPLNGVTKRANIVLKNFTTPSKRSSPSTSTSASSSLSLTRQSRESVTDWDSLDSAEIVALRRHTSRDSSGDSREGPTQLFLPTTDHYQQMVDEFKFNLVNKQVKQQQKQQHQHHPAYNEQSVNNTMASAGVNNNNSNNVDIPLRQAVSNHNKAKRQGMYLRLGDQHNLQNDNDDDRDEPLVLPQRHNVLDSDDHNNNKNSSSNNKDNHQKSIINREREHNVNNNDHDLSTVKSFDSDTDSATQESHDHQESCISRALNQQVSSSHTTITTTATSKRGGIHEHNILQAFEALLRQGQQQQQPSQKPASEVEETDVEESQTKDNNNTLPQLEVAQATSGQVLQPFVAHTDKQSTSSYWSPVFDLLDLINRLQLSCSLNTVVVRYDNNDKAVFVFLRYISRNGEKYKHATHGQLVRKYQRFHNYLYSATTTATAHTLTTLKHSASTARANSVDLKLDLMKTNGNLYGRIVVRNSEIPNNESFDDRSKANVLMLSETPETPPNAQNHNRRAKTPPEVPKRDPSTKLSPSTEQLPPLPAQRSPSLSKMTVPSGNLIKEAKGEKSHKVEESIYQPIWKCKTVGEVQERFKTDEDYYTLKDLQAERCELSPKSQEAGDEVPEICISEEDHSEWEPDEEFVFTTRLTAAQGTDSQDRNATIRSNRSHDSSIGSSSLSGSTITDFASSTATLASSVSSSLMHHLFRNVGIFYSLSEPKLRAIIYDYDRIHSTRYFAKNNIAPAADDINDSGLGKSPTPSSLSQNHHKQPHQQHRSPVPMQRLQTRENPLKCSESVTNNTSAVAKVVGAGVTAAATLAAAAIADSPAQQCIAPNSSVQAWKHQLLHVNYMEDEEDMLVSESAIVRAQKIKEEVESNQVPQFTQRFKSRSTENILDLPIEDDRKTIAERMRSRLQRGILNINNKSSPKSEKKLYKALRNSQTTSLYLEDGLKPKNPIFAAPLDQLELNQSTFPNVPRFVVDSIEYIERKDRIVQDGLYRACGNKFTIDELKQKLTKSYIYDPKLITADDIHTITSLLKQFFRDLPQPLIPQETYNRLARDLLKISEGIDTFRIAVNDMPEPNKSTLAFLIKHLTNVAACSASNRMSASNLAIVWGPSLFTLNEAKTYDIGRMNTLAKVLIENYDRIFHTNERLL